MTMRTFLAGVAGVAVGALLTVLLHSAQDSGYATPRGGASLDPAVLRLERAIDSLGVRLERLVPRAGGAAAPPDEPGAPADAAPPEAEGVPPADGPLVVRSRALADLARRPTQRERLVALEPQDARSRVLSTYYDVLEEFGQPTGTSAGNGVATLYYHFQDRLGDSRQLSFTFVDGLAFAVYYN